MRVVNGRIVESFQALLDPLGAFEDLQMRLHGITDADVVGAPTLAQVWPLLSALICRADRVVAHNAVFDRGVLEQTLRSQGIEPPALSSECTVIGSRRLLPELPNHRLPTVCGELGVALTQHHDALADALATARLATELDRLAAPAAVLASASEAMLAAA